MSLAQASADACVHPPSGWQALAQVALLFGVIRWMHIGLVAVVGYLGIDDERGEHALAAVPERQRSTIAVLAYGYSLCPLLVGIIVTAAGIKMSIAHGNEARPSRPPPPSLASPTLP
jgi:low temperature requirement protein LtrA